MAVALVAGAGNPAGGDLQGRKQTGDAAALVVVGMSLDLVRPHRRRGWLRSRACRDRVRRSAQVRQTTCRHFSGPRQTI